MSMNQELCLGCPLAGLSREQFTQLLVAAVKEGNRGDYAKAKASQPSRFLTPLDEAAVVNHLKMWRRDRLAQTTTEALRILGKQVADEFRTTGHDRERGRMGMIAMELDRREEKARTEAAHADR